VLTVECGQYNGDLSRADFSVAPYSGISAVFLGGHSILRVYGQLPNDTIQEWCCASPASSPFTLARLVMLSA